MELRAATCFLKRCLYGLMNLDQIPKTSLGSIVMHCVVKGLYAEGYLYVESAYVQLLLSPLKALDGSVDGDAFFLYFIRVPEMNPFDGPMSVAVMDNCSIHHTEDVAELFQSAGILLIYLPPYSLDMNPIELAFGYVKAYLKEHQDLLGFINHTHTDFHETSCVSDLSRGPLGFK